jgi:hypothetical protein
MPVKQGPRLHEILVATVCHRQDRSNGDKIDVQYFREGPRATQRRRTVLVVIGCRGGYPLFRVCLTQYTIPITEVTLPTQ